VKLKSNIKLPTKFKKGASKSTQLMNYNNFPTCHAILKIHPNLLVQSRQLGKNKSRIQIDAELTTQKMAGNKPIMSK